jgi:hypothetical protein
VNHSSTSHGYRSRFTKQLFDTAEQARAFDRAYAADALGALSQPEIDEAFSYGSARIDDLLRFIIDEMPYASAVEKAP